MSKLQSQWEFGDLFTAQAARRVFSVSELTSTVRRLLEQQLGKVWVTGEITNLRLQSSGHLYFTIKDASAQLSCVLFRGEARTFNRELLRDGVGVNLNGQLTVYEARGQYQLIVTAIELQGIGALQVAFEKLKQKLQIEGLFASERKRPLPRFAQRVGVVTSRTGAAIRDVLQAVVRRHPGAGTSRFLRLQGLGAGEEVACAIRLLNEWSESDAKRRVDLILVTRGGGSLEDLWAFNEEVVARAIFQSRIPVVSAVGHEIDFTISDFVADFSAATPSAAAEIITEGFFASRDFVFSAHERLAAWLARIDAARDELAFLVRRLARQHPLRWLQEQWQRLDDSQSNLRRCVRYGRRAIRRPGTRTVSGFGGRSPRERWSGGVNSSHVFNLDCLDEAARALLRYVQRLTSAQSKLRLLSPERPWSAAIPSRWTP